ncbi:MAG: hypothetical protein ACRDX8_07780 [Acidimicrobiales bacterium]
MAYLRSRTHIPLEAPTFLPRSSFDHGLSALACTGVNPDCLSGDQYVDYDVTLASCPRSYPLNSPAVEGPDGVFCGNAGAYSDFSGFMAASTADAVDMVQPDPLFARQRPPARRWIWEMGSSAPSNIANLHLTR